MITQKKLERRRKRREDVKPDSAVSVAGQRSGETGPASSSPEPDSGGREADDMKEQLEPGQPSPMDKSPSPSSPLTPHPYAGKVGVQGPSSRATSSLQQGDGRPPPRRAAGIEDHAGSGDEQRQDRLAVEQGDGRGLGCP